MAALYSTGVFDRNNNIAEDWAATKSRRINVLRLLLWNPMDTFSLGNQRMAVDAHLAACGRAGVLADHVTAVPDIVADGESSGLRLTQSAGGGLKTE